MIFVSVRLTVRAKLTVRVRLSDKEDHEQEILPLHVGLYPSLNEVAIIKIGVYFFLSNIFLYTTFSHFLHPKV